MKRSIAGLLAALILLALPVSAGAQADPEPSVTVSFHGVVGERYYATLLSETEASGPYSAAEAYEGDFPEADEAFAAFQASGEEYFYLHFADDCTEDQRLEWAVSPPDDFKILVWFADYDSFVLTGACKSRRSGGDFSVTFTPQEISRITAGGARFSVDAETRGGLPLRGLAGGLGRFLLALAVELGMALLWGYRQRRQLWLLLWVNVVTLFLLNVGLFFFPYQWGGGPAGMLRYGGMELAIFLVEGAVYSVKLTSRKEGRGSAVLYALVANVASFGTGVLLARLWPHVF